VKNNTTAEDRRRGLNRSENLRAIHESDKDWDRLYALRPIAESTNRWFKERLRDRRAPAVGVARQHLHLLFGSLFNNFRAWLAHSGRVGLGQPGAPPPARGSARPGAPLAPGVAAYRFPGSQQGSPVLKAGLGA